uniref:Putative ovule protein n=1 Tax=Solanum chacoense TaxID=4108 RepID=A0A0V0ICC7_SOLCH
MTIVVPLIEFGLYLHLNAFFPAMTLIFLSILYMYKYEISSYLKILKEDSPRIIILCPKRGYFCASYIGFIYYPV